MKLKDKVAVVTGGASGFGKAIAELFAKEGAKVVVADINGQGARDVAQGIGQPAVHLAADVSKRKDVEAMVGEAVSRFGGLDIMVNNAGYTHKNQPMLNVGEEEASSSIRHRPQASARVRALPGTTAPRAQPSSSPSPWRRSWPRRTSGSALSAR
jgi:NAD(P)-dependent dehydrogenase (short-subunit alcohol dehydrogenase family)